MGKKENTSDIRTELKIQIDMQLHIINGYYHADNGSWWSRVSSRGVLWVQWKLMPEVMVRGGPKGCHSGYSWLLSVGPFT